MVFSSLGYAVFLLALITFFGLVNVKSLQKPVLLLASYFFYSRWDWRFLCLLIGLTLSTFFCVRMMHKGPKKLWLTICILISLGTLAYFKYANFFLGSLSSITYIHTQLLDIILPIGISFIVFEVISYTVDVYRGEAKYEEDLLDFALLVAFFPHLISGPILKPNHFLPQLKKPIQITASNLSAGSQLFLWGLMKKVLVADRVAPYVDVVFQHPTAFTPQTTWLAVVAYAVQIYGDFSGYTDMAIGSAICLGFQIPQNFNLPYFARNLTEFWRRWHISLSSWLRDYLYIPLGGNRKGVWRTYVNLAVVMLLGGLWHGASWNFILWGGLHGVGLAIHRLFNEYKLWPKLPSTPALVLSWAFTIVFVLTAWVPFRSTDWAVTIQVLQKMYGLGVPEQVRWYSVSLLFAIPSLIVADVASRAWFRGRRLKLTQFSHQIFFFFCAIGTLALAPPASSPFIYFQF